MTAQDLINVALRKIGVLAAGESPSSDESADALIALNELLASWSAQALPVYQIAQELFVLTGAGSYTIGSAMTFNTTRPIKIEAAAVLSNSISVPVEIVPVERWTAELDRAATGTFARVLYYDAGYPTATIYLAPKPSAGSLELHSYKELTALASLATTVTFPPGYERALAYGLAVELAPEYGRPIDEGLAALAGDAKSSVFGLNRAVDGPPDPVVPVREAA